MSVTKKTWQKSLDKVFSGKGYERYEKVALDWRRHASAVRGDGGWSALCYSDVRLGPEQYERCDDDDFDYRRDESVLPGVPAESGESAACLGRHVRKRNTGGSERCHRPDGEGWRADTKPGEYA